MSGYYDCTDPLTRSQDKGPDLSPSKEVGLRDRDQHKGPCSEVRPICREMNLKRKVSTPIFPTLTSSCPSALTPLLEDFASLRKACEM